MTEGQTQNRQLSLQNMDLTMILIVLPVFLWGGDMLGGVLGDIVLLVSQAMGRTLDHHTYMEVITIIGALTRNGLLLVLSLWLLRRAGLTLAHTLRKPPGWGWLWISLGAGLALRTVWSVTGLILTPDDILDVQRFTGIPWQWVVALGLVARVLIAPLCEEIYFRGILQPALGRWQLPWLPVPLSATIFASLHLHYLFEPALAFVFAVGLIAAGLYKRYQTALPSALFHIVMNLMMSLSFLRWLPFIASPESKGILWK